MKAIVRVYDDLEFDIFMLMECDKYEIDRAQETVKEAIDCCIRQHDKIIDGLLFMDTDGSFARMELWTKWTDKYSDSWECMMFNGQIYALCGIN